MTRYLWMIHTAEQESEETPGDVYLSLHGLRSNTKELQLPERDYASATVVSGTIETRGDLGELQTGILRTEYPEKSAWAPDWVRVINLSDGRQWKAEGGVCGSDGTFPLLRFERTDDPSALQKSNGSSADAGSSKRSDTEEVDNTDPAKPVVRTYEIFGKRKGRVVPLAEILKFRAGVKQLSSGAQIFITSQDSQGFGLGGEPGMWDELYSGFSPAVYGLEPDMAVMASDGSRGWVLDAHALAMIFGAEWRRVVYGK